MKVLLVVKTAEGGLWILAHIAALRARGHETTVILPTGDGRLRRALDDARVRVVPTTFDFGFPPRPATLAGLLRLRRQIKALEPDILHYHLYASALAARFATLGMRLPSAYMVAGPLYLESHLIRSVERWLVRLDTVLIAGSDHTAKLYGELGRVQGVVTIPYGVDIGHFAPQPRRARSQTRAALDIPESDFVAVMVAYVYAPKARVHPDAGLKGHDPLLISWQEFHRRHADSRLVLVGGGFDAAGAAHRDALIRKFGTADPGSGVIWLDSVDDVRPYYAAADLSICPSLSENHGAALEATAMGVPCIVSDAGGLPETVDEATGWIVPAGDAGKLTDALFDARREWSDGSLEGRATLARERVKRFARGPAAERLVDLLENLSAGTPGGQVRIFTEARFGQDASGNWAAMDAANDGRLWDRYAGLLPGVQVAARALPVPSTASEPLGCTKVVPLPYFVGRRQLARVGNLLVAVFRAVGDAELCILRVPGLVTLTAALCCRLIRRPYVVEVVGDPAEVLKSGVLGVTGRLAAPVAALAMRRAVKGADACRYVTSRTLQRRYPPRRQVPQLSMSNVRLSDADYLSRTDCAIDGPIDLVTIGTHEQLYKGHDVLLRASALLQARGREVRLHVVGDGRYHGDLQDLARTLGLGSAVTFYGAVHDRQRIHEILDSSDLFVLPSRTEGLPRALIEAMARGLPAIASDVGGSPELLPAVALVTADRPDLLAAKIEVFAGDKALRENHSRRNYEAAQPYHRDLLDAVFTTWLQVVARIATGQTLTRTP